MSVLGRLVGGHVRAGGGGQQPLKGVALRGTVLCRWSRGRSSRLSTQIPRAVVAEGCSRHGVGRGQCMASSSRDGGVPAAQLRPNDGGIGRPGPTKKTRRTQQTRNAIRKPTGNVQTFRRHERTRKCTAFHLLHSVSQSASKRMCSGVVSGSISQEPATRCRRKRRSSTTCDASRRRHGSKTFPWFVCSNLQPSAARTGFAREH